MNPCRNTKHYDLKCWEKCPECNHERHIHLWQYIDGKIFIHGDYGKGEPFFGKCWFGDCGCRYLEQNENQKENKK